MKLEGPRIVGLLLAWLSLGFFFQAATAGLLHDLLASTSAETGPAPGLAYLGLLAGLGTISLGSGLGLLLRTPGPGRTPGVELGHAREHARAPKRCWRCRASWPAEAERCPRCGAERLA